MLTYTFKRKNINVRPILACAEYTADKAKKSIMRHAGEAVGIVLYIFFLYLYTIRVK